MQRLGDSTSTRRVQSSGQLAFLVEELDNLLSDEREKTVKFVVIIAWLTPLSILSPLIRHQAPLWYLGLLFLYAISIQWLYLFRKNYLAFITAGIGAVLLFIIQYVMMPFDDLTMMIESASLFTIVGTLFFRRRYLFYSNIASALLFIVAAIVMLFRHQGIAQTFNSLLDGLLVWCFVASACWLFMIRSLRLLEKLTEAKGALMVDALTETYNRAYFDSTLTQLQTNTPKDKVSLLIFDVDHFKQVNDTYGHLAGDRVLAHFTSTVRKHTRKSDVFVRIGGEEFALIVWHDEHFSLSDYASRLLLAVSNHPFQLDDVTTIPLATSIGGATYIPTGESIHNCLNRADQALYLAKDAGRNRAILL